MASSYVWPTILVTVRKNEPYYKSQKESPVVIKNIQQAGFPDGHPL
jgi:hypothetical protein